MDLRSAILAAGRFCCPPGKAVSPLSGIRLLPKSGEFPARVYATNLVAAIMLDVEQDLPNLVVDATGIEAAVKAEPDAQVTLDQDTVVVGKYRFRPWCPVDRYPGFLSIPTPEFFQRIPDSSGISKVLHALGKDATQPELTYVSFRPGFIEATDSTRVARVPIGINRTLQVHGACFDGWPGGPVEYAADPNYAVFRWSGEVRWGEVYRGNALRPYPNLGLIEDTEEPTTRVVVPVRELRQVVKRAAQASPFRVVSCRFRDGGIDVTGLNGAGVGFHDEVPALCRGGSVMALNGVALVAALDAADTPRVLLDVWSQQGSPLRVKSGSYSEHIWPVVG